MNRGEGSVLGHHKLLIGSIQEMCGVYVLLSTFELANGRIFYFLGVGCESGRRLHDDYWRDAAVLPDQTGVVLHSVPTHPSARAEEHRPTDEGQASKGGAKGARGRGACRGSKARGAPPLQVLLPRSCRVPTFMVLFKNSPTSFTKVH